MDTEQDFVNAVKTSLQLDFKFDELIALAYKKAKPDASVMNLIYPLISREIRFDHLLIGSIHPDHRVVTGFFDTANTALRQLDTWVREPIQQTVENLPLMINGNLEQTSRMLKCCVLFSDSSLDLYASMELLGRDETCRRLREMAAQIYLGNLVT
jgi:hypothetical protein